MTIQRSLEDDVSAAFERALREHDLLVAEHLLQALEAIARRDGNDLPVRIAYRELAQSLPNRLPFRHKQRRWNPS